jgi:predicted ABC-type sugar transport system permease subunit
MKRIKDVVAAVLNGRSVSFGFGLIEGTMLGGLLVASDVSKSSLGAVIFTANADGKEIRHAGRRC